VPGLDGAACQLAGWLPLAAVSKMEHQSDVYVSTLRRFIAALGSELRIVAHFPHGDVVINQFEDIRKQSVGRSG